VVATPQPDDPAYQIKALEKRIDEMERKTLYSAQISDGGLTIKGGFIRLLDDAGQERLYIGPSSFSMPPGETQPVFWVRDASGRIRLGVYDNNAGGYEPTFWTFDDSSNVAFTTDINGGVAEPWVYLPMYPKFIPTNFANSTGTEPTLPASSCNGGVIWAGRIGKVSHPFIQFDIVTGRVTGTGATPTYTLWVGGVQLASYTNAAFFASVHGPYDISSLIGDTNVVVEIKVSATGTGTDLISCGVNGVALRQT
jgi:hypothetical protein